MHHAAIMLALLALLASTAVARGEGEPGSPVITARAIATASPASAEATALGATLFGNPALPDQGPSATFSAGGQRLQMTPGTRCWTTGSQNNPAVAVSACIDYVAPVSNVDPLPVAPGAPFTIDFGAGQPSQLELTWGEVGNSTGTVNPQGLLWFGGTTDPDATRAGGGGNDASVPTTPGRYLVTAFAQYDGRGDLSYAWYIEVTDGN
jgi:hypothetical protein